MRVKIGETWYDLKDVPIAIEIEADDEVFREFLSVAVSSVESNIIAQFSQSLSDEDNRAWFDQVMIDAADVKVVHLSRPEDL